MFVPPPSFNSVLSVLVKVRLIFEVQGQQDDDDEEPLCFVFVEYLKAAHNRRGKANWCHDSIPNWPHLLTMADSDRQK